MLIAHISLLPHKSSYCWEILEEHLKSFTPLLTPDDHISLGVKSPPDKCQTLVEKLCVTLYFKRAVRCNC